MSVTHGYPHRARHFVWRFDAAGQRVEITNNRGREHAFSVSEIHTILHRLHSQFGDGWFPLANNVEHLGDGDEQAGLGMTILGCQPGNTTHAQGASYLGIVLEECAFLQWNGRHHGIQWRIIEAVPNVATLEQRLAAHGHSA